jgi:transposase
MRVPLSFSAKDLLRAGKDTIGMTRTPLEMVEVDTKQLDDVLRRAEESLTADDYKLTEAIFESYAYLADLVDDKNTSIRRLRQLLFGARTEKTDSVVGDSDQDQPEPDCTSSDDGAGEPAADDSLDDESEEEETKKGHGRNGADAYRGGERIEIPHPSLKAGDGCPECQQGKLYDNAPGVLVRIVGQAPLHARVYELQKLRCQLCGKLFTAEPPPEAGAKKYDATAASMIALLKYGSGLPFNRLEGLQRNLEIPLPASTQWDVVHAFAPSIKPALDELIRQAAQGEVLHNDDTTAKILELMGKRRQQSSDTTESTRTGIFTSGVVAVREGQKIALFFSGRQHAGENLSDVLQYRSEELARPIQMCDALSRNLTPDLETIVAHCLAHGRRQFVDVYDRFPEECRYVLEALKVVYRNETNTQRRKLSPQKRLQFHRIKSQQTMSRLHNYLVRQFDEKRVEPNSALGGAMRYMLNHWEKLTLFLREAGAPLDNNLCERALKKAILHRKNALFFKTQNGARVGDMYMSLIHTCELCGASPLDYLVTLKRQAEALSSHPEQWLPWNYKSRMTALACG